MDQISTMELQSELSAREGVKTFVVHPYDKYVLTIGNDTFEGTGPCIIAVNED